MIELVAIAVLWIWGVRALFSEGFFLEEVGIFMSANLPSWACKPIFKCPPCMASVHGTLIYLVFNNHHVIHEWILYCVCVCGLNFLIIQYLWPETDS